MDQAAAATMSTDTVQLILADQSRLKEERAPYESVWREIDRYVDPFGSGGFNDKRTGFGREVEDLYDVTAIDGLDRYTAAIAGITIPRQQRWHGVEFADPELMKVAAVRRWCEHAADRLFLARYAPHTGFESQMHEDIRQEGKYGTSGLWIGDRPGRGIFYKALHMGELFIDEDYCGRVDRVHRPYVTTIKKAADEFGGDILSDKSRAALEDPKKRNGEIEILHVVRPNTEYEPGYLGAKGKPIESLYIETGEKHAIRRSGFNSMPIPVSRHITGPRDKYGRSPAMKVLATVKGANDMARTILDAGNRAVDPPLLYYDDADITKIVTRPGGATAGGVDDQGRPLVHPLITGQNLPIGLELIEQERGVIKRAFLDEFFRLLTDPSDRMTATQVMETLQKEGVLIAPYAGRRETEKLGPMIERELDILMRNGVIEAFPPEVLEAKAKPRIQMTNPLSRMARAEEVTGFTRLAEIGVQLAGAGFPEGLERVNVDAGMVAAADVLGVRPSLVYSDDEVAERRAAKKQEQGAMQEAAMAPQMAGAAKDLAQANKIAADVANGGGLG
jgi:hypothetical protein